MVLKIFFFISSGYIIVWKSKGLFTSKLEQFYKALLSNRKGFAYKMGTQFNNTALVKKKQLLEKTETCPFSIIKIIGQEIHSTILY